MGNSEWDQLGAVVRLWIQEAVREAMSGMAADVARRVEEALSHGAARVPVYLTAEEAAALVKVKPATVRAWVARGDLRRCFAGRYLRIRLSDLDAFLQRQPGDDETHDDGARVNELLADATRSK